MNDEPGGNGRVAAVTATSGGRESHRSRTGDGPSRRVMATVAGALVRRPRLWRTALATVVHLAPRGWWRRRPFLPLPDGRLWAFRMETAYGRADADPPVEDVVGFLEWCRRGAGPAGSGGTGPVHPGTDADAGPPPTDSAGAGPRVVPAKFQG